MNTPQGKMVNKTEFTSVKERIEILPPCNTPGENITGPEGTLPHYKNLHQTTNIWAELYTYI